MIVVVVVETGTHMFVAQAGLRDPPALASQNAGITDENYYAQPEGYSERLGETKIGVQGMPRSRNPGKHLDFLLGPDPNLGIESKLEIVQPSQKTGIQP